MDNDGKRDLLMAVKYKPSVFATLIQRLIIDKEYPRIWDFYLYQNLANFNHWLQIKLIGPEENRVAIGARVEVETKSGVMLQQVGNAEGSHASQGHYRMYFGLGSEPRPQRVTVIWPDGSTRVLKEPDADRLIVIQHGL
jgi:hypothetical protein